MNMFFLEGLDVNRHAISALVASNSDNWQYYAALNFVPTLATWLFSLFAFDPTGSR